MSRNRADLDFDVRDGGWGNTVNQAVLMATLVSASSRRLVNLEFLRGDVDQPHHTSGIQAAT